VNNALTSTELKRPPRRFCKCGCKKPVTPGRMFVNGHNRKGKKHTEKSLGKMREAQKGKTFSKTHRKNMSRAKKGVKLPEITRSRMSESRTGEKHPMYGRRGKDSPLYGRECPKERRKKISDSLKGKCSGEKSAAWRGGIANDPYCPIFYDPEFKELIFKRDGYECQNSLCWKNCDHMPLIPHHINYNKMDCDSRNIITVCWSCNSRANFNREFWQKHYEDIMRERGLA